MGRVAAMNLSLGGKEILPWETSALALYVFGFEKDWNKVFQAAAYWTQDSIERQPKLFRQYVSTWKNSQKVKKELQRLELYRDTFLQQARKEAFEDGKRAYEGEHNTITENQVKYIDGTRTRGIDYSDPQAQKDKLNDIINNASDPGEALDALKVIIQGQKNDQEAAKDKQVQRFYTPLRCHDCPLYNMAKEKDRPKE